MQKKRVIIIGGGAAGFFAAITCAKNDDDGAGVTVLEASAQPLAKVGVSGGGRCNVTHACFDPRELVRRYPRGGRELLGAFHRWQPQDTVAWFAKHGVALKSEADGRMFPVTDDSQTVIDCLRQAAVRAGVTLRLQSPVNDVSRDTGGGFSVSLNSGETLRCDRLLIATGGGKSSGGHVIAKKLGHTIEPPVPSLFTFKIADPRLDELAGLSVASVSVSVRGSKLRETGPVLITHRGLSGPAILKLSAWGARELHACNYNFPLCINWLGDKTADQARAALPEMRRNDARRQITTWNPFSLPQRLWEKLVRAAGIADGTVWATLSKAGLNALVAQLTEGVFPVTGQNTNKDEFVTCGGVRLSEVDFKTMESRVCAGLFFAGETLDIDGVTGGFNFQAAWTTGYLAGAAMGGI